MNRMNQNLFAILVLIASLNSGIAQKKNVVDYVNPLIGTPVAGFMEGRDG